MMSFSFEDIRKVDGDLAGVLDQMDPREVSHLRGVTAAEGEWIPPADGPGMGHMVIAGFLARHVELAGGSCIELFGPGELLMAADNDAGDPFDMVPADVRWTALAPVVLAELGGDFARSAAAHPALQAALLARETRRSDALALRMAVIQLPRVSSRLNFLLWHLAERFGSPGQSGVLIPIHLSHGLLAEMVGAEPAEVRTALRELAEQGVISQAPRGLWLNGGPPSLGPQQTASALSRA